jgi:hypothetical protein
MGARPTHAQVGFTNAAVCAHAIIGFIAPALILRSIAGDASPSTPRPRCDASRTIRTPRSSATFEKCLRAVELPVRSRLRAPQDEHSSSPYSQPLSFPRRVSARTLLHSYFANPIAGRAGRIYRIDAIRSQYRNAVRSWIKKGRAERSALKLEFESSDIRVRRGRAERDRRLLGRLDRGHHAAGNAERRNRKIGRRWAARRRGQRSRLELR